MAQRRKQVSPRVETGVMLNCMRRCCLCYYLDDNKKRRPGQIAHLDRDALNAASDNLVFLCFDHHHEYDSISRQGKGFRPEEVKSYRNRLSAEVVTPQQEPLSEQPSRMEEVPDKNPQGDKTLRPWRFPLWQARGEYQLFPFKADMADGVCLIEKIVLPDGRIVVACLEAPGNPGSSITNSVENIAGQVCERFDIDPARLVWLENYPDMDAEAWDRVLFAQHPPHGHFSGPDWLEMTPMSWHRLKLKPTGAPVYDGYRIRYNLEQMFEYPNEEKS